MVHKSVLAEFVMFEQITEFCSRDIPGNIIVVCNPSVKILNTKLLIDPVSYTPHSVTV